MAEYTAHFETTVTAEVPDDVAAQGAEAVSEWIYMNGDVPSICAQCSGWGCKASLDLGDFEAVQHESGPNKGTAYVTDADGNEVQP